MTASRLLAHRYARALLLAATAAREVDQVAADLELVSTVLGQEARLREILGGILIPRSRQRELIRRLFEGRVRGHVLNLLYLLLDERRMGLLGHIVRQYQIMADEGKGVVRVEVVAASAFSEQGKELLQQALERRLKKRVRLEVTVDPDLIGGVQVRIGDTLYDGSVRGQLRRLRERMARG